MTETTNRCEQTLNDIFTEYTFTMSDNELLNLNNAHSRAVSIYDDEILEMCEFDDICDGMTPTQIIQSIDPDEFDTGDDFIKYTIWGWKSFNDISYEIDTDDIFNDIESELEDLIVDELDLEEVPDFYINEDGEIDNIIEKFIKNYVLIN